MQLKNIAIKAILNDVTSAKIPISGGDISKPSLDTHVAKVTPLVVFIFGSCPINDIINGNVTDIPNPMREKPSMVKKDE